MSGAGFDMVGGTQVPFDLGLPGDPGGPAGGDDFDSAEDFEPMSTTGCSHCGYTGGDCMSPGDHCPFAKKMRAPKVQAVAVDNAVDLSEHWTPPVVPVQADGVWLTYFEANGQEGGDVCNVSVHRTELEALRVAVEFNHRATFLKYGELL